ncbi:zinc finger, C2H2 type [Cooperia oncophora]
MLTAMIQPSFTPPQRPIEVPDPFNAQFFNMLMNSQLQHFFNSLPRSEKGKDENIDEQRSQCSFSIDNLLRPESDEKQVKEAIALTHSMSSMKQPPNNIHSLAAYKYSKCFLLQTSNSPDSDVTAYTLDALEVSDGRTKQERKFPSSRCVCDQCGKSYATTSNLSRHKQTHRPLDSEHAKQCPHCDRVYVSMPALR